VHHIFAKISPLFQQFKRGTECTLISAGFCVANINYQILQNVNASIEFFGISTLAMLHHRNGGNDIPSVLNNRNLVIFFCVLYNMHGSFGIRLS
jgi:hypothetical protein